MSLGILRMVWERSPYDGQMLLLHLSLADCSGSTGYVVSGSMTTDNLVCRCQFRGRAALYEALNVMEADGHIEHTINIEDEDSDPLEDHSVSYTLNLHQLNPDQYEAAYRRTFEENNALKQQLNEPPISGYVYLLKSGPYYKIGKANDPQRRMDQLAIQLPHESEILHTIASQTPHLLERYWHQKFSDKRMNGEWFNLDHTDVSMFYGVHRLDLQDMHIYGIQKIVD